MTPQGTGVAEPIVTYLAPERLLARVDVFVRLAVSQGMECLGAETALEVTLTTMGLPVPLQTCFVHEMVLA